MFTYRSSWYTLKAFSSRTIHLHKRRKINFFWPLRTWVASSRHSFFYQASFFHTRKWRQPRSSRYFYRMFAQDTIIEVSHCRRVGAIRGLKTDIKSVSYCIKGIIIHSQSHRKFKLISFHVLLVVPRHDTPANHNIYHFSQKKK